MGFDVMDIETIIIVPFDLLMYFVSNISSLWIFDFKHLLNRKECLLMTSVFVLSIFGILIEVSFLFTIMIYLICLSINFYIYFKMFKSWITPVLFVSLKYILIILSWFISFDLPNMLFGTTFFSSFSKIIWFTVIQQLVLLLLLLLINYLFLRYNVYYNLHLLKRKYTLLSIVYIFTTTVLAILRQTGSYPNHAETILISLFALTCSLIMVFLFTYIISEKQFEISKIDLFQQIKDSENKYIEQIKNFEHDYKNTLLVLSEYFNQNQYSEANKYLSELIEYSKKTFSDSSYLEIYKIPNIEIQNYLMPFIATCSTNNVDVSFYLFGDPYLIVINPINSTRIISIVTNNALEACLENDSSSIDITFSYLADRTEISIQNTYKNQIEISKISKKNYTTKSTHSGRGLFILKEILDEYNSGYEVYCDNEYFTIVITIPR